MYLDVTSLGMFLTYLMKGNGSAEVGGIVVVSRCFASCRVVTTAANRCCGLRNNASDVRRCQAPKLDT